MRLGIGILCAVLLAAGSAIASSYHSMYARLGGYTGVRAISSDLVARFASDPQLAGYFSHVTPAQREALAKYAADYACKEAGASCTPHMPDLRLVEKPPRITNAQRRAALSDLKQTLAAHNVPRDIEFVIFRIVR